MKIPLTDAQQLRVEQLAHQALLAQQRVDDFCEAIVLGTDAPRGQPVQYEAGVLIVGPD